MIQQSSTAQCRLGAPLTFSWGLRPHRILKGLGAAPRELARRFVLLGADEVTTLKYLESLEALDIFI